ncbi:MAG: hypothetical protein ACE5OS_11125 [Anaerolineae bacterium]
MARRKGAYKRYLAHRRRDERLAASREAEGLAATLQAHLTPARWSEVEARWEARPDLYLPDQRRDFLVSEATRLGMLDLVPLSVFGE